MSSTRRRAPRRPAGSLDRAAVLSTYPPLSCRQDPSDELASQPATGAVGLTARSDGSILRRSARTLLWQSAEAARQGPNHASKNTARGSDGAFSRSQGESRTHTASKTTPPSGTRRAPHPSHDDQLMEKEKGTSLLCDNVLRRRADPHQRKEPGREFKILGELREGTKETRSKKGSYSRGLAKALHFLLFYSITWQGGFPPL